MMQSLFISWDPDAELLQFGSWALRWYSLCWGIGLLLAFFVVRNLYQRQGIPGEKFEPLFLYCFVGILLGARLGHCLFYEPAYFLPRPLEMILPLARDAEGSWHFTGYAGLASHGGTLGLMLALWLYVRRYKVNILRVLDNIALATPVTACLIRLGNLFNSEIVGCPTQMPWGFVFLQNGENFARHPAQLYEAVAYLVFFFIGLWLYRRRPDKAGTGFYFGLCLTLIFSFRFVVEFWKDVQVGFEESMPLNMGQLLSLPFIAIGLYFLRGKGLPQRWGEKRAK